jgi:hypothetical protein
MERDIQAFGLPPVPDAFSAYSKLKALGAGDIIISKVN